MNQIWNESDIIVINGERCLNEEASERFYQVYKDKLPLRGNMLYKLGWAEKVCTRYPRMYTETVENAEPVVESTDSHEAEPELVDANNVYNLANVKKVIDSFDDAYKANPNIDLVDYLLLNLAKVLSVRPININDMIKFGNYIVSKPEYSGVKWDQTKLETIIEQGEITSYFKVNGFKDTLYNKATTPERVIYIIKLALKELERTKTRDFMSELEINKVVADFLAEQSKEFQNETERMLKHSGTSLSTIYDYVALKNHPVENSEKVSEVEQFIINACKEVNVTNPKMTKEQWLLSLLDSIYLAYELKASDVKELLAKHIINKPPYNIDELLLSSYVVEKDRQIKSCEKDSDVLIEEYIISANDLEIINNLEYVYYNVDERKWNDFVSKLASRIHTDLTSISTVDPITLKKLNQLIIISGSYHDKSLIDRLILKFGKTKEELIQAATENLNKIRTKDPFKPAGDLKPIDLDDDDEDDYEDEEEEELSVVSRKKPLTKEGKKKILYASIAGVGIISTLFLTFVQGYNPVTVVTECVKTFGALLKNNATLAQLGLKLGQLSVYFASIIVSFKSLFKFADTFDETKVSKSKEKKKKKVDEDDYSLDDDEEEDYSFIGDSDLVGDLSDEELHRVPKR